MLNNSIFIQIGYLLLAVITQILIFNQINISGYFPIVYIMWIYFFSLESDTGRLLILSFFLGLIIDLFLGTGGIHAFSCVFIAFIKKTLIRIFASYDYELENFSYQSFGIVKSIIFTVFFIFIHHSVLYLLDNFKLDSFGVQIKKALINTFITLIFGFIIKIIFSPFNKSETL